MIKSILKNSKLLIFILLFGSCIPEYDDSSPVSYIVSGSKDQFPAWSPDGEEIAYYHFSQKIPEPEEYPTGLYIIDKNGDNRRLVLKGDHFSPTWSPDGKWLVFSSGGVIQKCRIDGDSLTTFDGLDHLPAPEFYFPHWTKDGKYILFDKPLVSDMGVYYMTSDFQKADNLIASGRDPELAPDGDKFIYYGWVSNSEPSEIFIRDINGLHEERLTNNERSDISPTWSPDGKMIAWSSSVRLCIMNADGSNQKRIAYGNDPSWSVNNEIVFSHANAWLYQRSIIYY